MRSIVSANVVTVENCVPDQGTHLSDLDASSNHDDLNVLFMGALGARNLAYLIC